MSTGLPQWLVLALNLALTISSLLAAITARASLQALRKRLADRSTRSLRQLDAEVTDLASGLSSISMTLKRQTSRATMRELRAKGTLHPDLSQMTPPERKAALRRALANGEMRVIRDGDPSL